MMKGLARRQFLAALGATAGTGSWAEALDLSLRPLLRPAGIAERSIPPPHEVVAAARLSGQVSFAVADARSGRVLERHNAALAATPASVAKSVTALYALDALGSDYRFQTRVVATGGIRNGAVLGDLVLVGGGDPSLDSDGLAELAAQVKAAGIHEVKGDLLVWDRALPRIDRIDPAQPDQAGYNPAISGIALNYNRVHFQWTRTGRSYQVTLDARTARYSPEVSMARIEVVDRAHPVYTYRRTPRRDEWTVALGALGGDGARWLPVRLPALYAGDVFATMARSHGIVLASPKVIDVAPTGTELGRVASAPLRDILRGMLKYSNNLIAEMVGLGATAARTGRAPSLRGSATEMSRWARERLGMERTMLVDHSGLGEASRMTADDMCGALVQTQSASFRPLLKSLPVPRDGHSRTGGAQIPVNAKTGTLNFVSSLAGYMTAPDGRELAFAIFSGDLDRRQGAEDSDSEIPSGARTWNNRAKDLQKTLISRWVDLRHG